MLEDRFSGLIDYLSSISALTLYCVSLTAMTLAASSAYLPLVTLSGKVGSDTSIIGEQSGQEAAIVVNDVSTDITKSLC